MKTTYSKGTNGQKAETFAGNWFISTTKCSYSSIIRCSAVLCDELGAGLMRYSSDSPRHQLGTSQGRATAAEIKRVHELGLAEFVKREPEFAGDASPAAIATPAAGPPPPQQHTPWGRPDSIKDYGDEGIRFYSTPGHGGFFVPPEVATRMPASYRNADGWYEEDSEWAKVALSFPDLFDAGEVAAAERTAINWSPDEYMAATGIKLTPADSYMLAKRHFQESTKDKLVVLAAWGSGPVAGHPELPPVPKGWVGVCANLGGNRTPGNNLTVHYRLVPDAEYSDRGQHGFIITDAHPDWATWQEPAPRPVPAKPPKLGALARLAAAFA